MGLDIPILLNFVNDRENDTSYTIYYDEITLT